jgi:hypothetical protein
MVHSYVNGHRVFFYKDSEEIRYEDEEVYDTFKSTDKPNFRPCPKCGKLPTKEGHDDCLGNLPGVMFACCGHGVKKGYIKFKNGVVIHGTFDVRKT